MTPDQLSYQIPPRFQATVYPTFQHDDLGNLQNLAQVYCPQEALDELSEWLLEHCRHLEWTVITGPPPPF